jgi:hypothetical protein
LGEAKQSLLDVATNTQPLLSFPIGPYSSSITATTTCKSSGRF